MIRIDHISHRIGTQEILADVSLDLPRGGVTALIGPNGAGKSTLLSLAARLLAVQQGSITIDGLPLAGTPGDVLARRIAILPQASDIAPRLTVAELVGFGRYPHSKGRPTARCLARIEDAIDRFDLAPLRNRMIDTLSGGQRQRAMIAMTYAQDTDYLLLDEPLNNLDITAARHLMLLLRQMAEADGKTILIVLHDINYATAYADRIIALQAGRIMADGTPRDVVSESNLARIFGTDVTVILQGNRPFVVV
jgi:iron complex transport system ATP-binding protein